MVWLRTSTEVTLLGRNRYLDCRRSAKAPVQHQNSAFRNALPGTFRLTGQNSTASIRQGYKAPGNEQTADILRLGHRGEIAAFKPDHPAGGFALSGDGASQIDSILCNVCHRHLVAQICHSIQCTVCPGEIQSADHYIAVQLTAEIIHIDPVHIQIAELCFGPDHRDHFGEVFGDAVHPVNALVGDSIQGSALGDCGVPAPAGLVIVPAQRKVRRVLLRYAVHGDLGHLGKAVAQITGDLLAFDPHFLIHSTGHLEIFLGIFQQVPHNNQIAVIIQHPSVCHRLLTGDLHQGRFRGSALRSDLQHSLTLILFIRHQCIGIPGIRFHTQTVFHRCHTELCGGRSFLCILRCFRLLCRGLWLIRGNSIGCVRLDTALCRHQAVALIGRRSFLCGGSRIGRTGIHTVRLRLNSLIRCISRRLRHRAVLFGLLGSCLRFLRLCPVFPALGVVLLLAFLCLRLLFTHRAPVIHRFVLPVIAVIDLIEHRCISRFPLCIRGCGIRR